MMIVDRIRGERLTRRAGSVGLFIGTRVRVRMRQTCHIEPYVCDEAAHKLIIDWWSPPARA